jgi:anti-sigma B factor antagonist
LSDQFEMTLTRHEPDVVVARVSGWLGGESAAQLLERCTRACGAGRHLVLDLSGVTFISSVGVGAILTLSDSFQRTSRSVRLAATSTPVFSVLRLLNLDTALSLDPTEEAALEALQAAREGRTGTAPW